MKILSNYNVSSINKLNFSDKLRIQKQNSLKEESLANQYSYNPVYYKPINFKGIESVTVVDNNESIEENEIDTQINALEETRVLIKKYSEMNYLLQEDEKITKTSERKSAINKIINDNDYDVYGRKGYLGDESLIPVIVWSKKEKIKDGQLKNLLKTIAEYPLNTVDFKPSDEITRNFFFVSMEIEMEDEDRDVVRNEIVESNNYISLKAKDFETALMSGQVDVSSEHEKAQLIVGSHLLQGNLRDYLTEIYERDVKECTDTDAEVLKICADNIDNECYRRNRENNIDPDTLLYKRLEIISANHKDDKKLYYNAVADLGMQNKTAQGIYRTIQVVQSAPTDIQNDIIPDLYAHYGKIRIADYDEECYLSYDKNASESEAMEIIEAYRKYIGMSDSVKDDKVLEYMNFLERIYSNPPKEDTGFEDTPLLDDLDSVNDSLEQEELKKLLSWQSDSKDDELQKLVRNHPGKDRINERKYLDMKKQFEEVFFQSRFNNKMDNKMKEIEKELPPPETYIHVYTKSV